MEFTGRRPARLGQADGVQARPAGVEARAGGFDPELRSHVEATWQRLLVERNDAATLALMRLLEDEGLTALVLKGPATRASLGLVGERPSSDIDVLVSPDQLGRARAVLSARGYTRKLGVHADAWSRPGEYDVDLHWTMPRVGVSAAKASQVLLAHLDWLRCASGVVPVLDAPGRLVHLALHATMDDSGRPQDDLARALARATASELADAAELARLLKCSTAVSWALRSVGRDDLAEPFGPAPEVLGTARGAGGWAFLKSGVHWRESVRRQARLSQNWVRWQSGRLGRLITGRARTNQRLAQLLRRGR